MHRDEDWWLGWQSWQSVPRRAVNGVSRERLEVGDAGDVEITFLGEEAGYRNSLFVYRIEDDGSLVDLRLVWADTSDRVSDRGWSRGPQRDGPLDAGDSIRLSELYTPDQIRPGQDFGLLLLQNGYNRNPQELFADAEGFRLVDRRGGGEVDLDTPARRIRLVHGEGDDATVLRGGLLFTTDPRDDGGWRNPLNRDGREHVPSRPGEEDGQTQLFFEDLLWRRGDYNDLRLLVDTDPDPLSPCPVRLDEEGLGDGRGVVVRGEEGGDRAGQAVALIGDFDGDGYGDVAIGAPLAGVDGQGAVYILFGRGEDIPDTVQLRGEGGSSMTTLYGAAAGDFLGSALAAAGDVDGDGYDDLVIGATGLDGGAPDSGGAYLLFGGPRPASQSSIEDLDADRLLRIDGVAAGDETGIAVAGGGDIDGDGFDDILIGARLAEADYARYSAGVSYLLLGGADGPTTDLAALDGSDGMRITGVDRFDQSGRAVAVLGDIDGDGFDDLAVGAPDADPGGRENAGEVYVLYGDAGGFPASLDPAAMEADRGFRIEGADPFDYAGFAVSGAGDVNGDGFDDILIGAYARDTAGGEAAGAAYLVFGSADGHPDGLDLGDLDGSNGFAMFGLSPMAGTGRAVAAAGDVNGDGFDDFVVGARYADPEGVGGAGEVYLIYGRAGPFDAVLDLSTLDGEEGCLLIGTRGEAYAGFSFGGPGDIDGDGFDDLVIGAPATPDGTSAGTAFAVFGGSRFAPSLASLVEDPTPVV